MSGQVITDIQFLSHPDKRQHYLYRYIRDSGMFRSKVQDQIEVLADEFGWIRAPIPESSGVFGELASASLFGDKLIVCEAGDWTLRDLAETLGGIAADAFEHHALILVRDDSKLLGLAAWREAIAKVGLIEEPKVTIKNYRAVARYLLRSSDLGDLTYLGEDKPFLTRLKTFVQERNRAPFELGMKIDEIFLTQISGGVLLEDDSSSVTSRRERRVLSEYLNHFLSGPNTATLFPLITLLDAGRVAMVASERLLVRLYDATEAIVLGRDQRYGRNRKGNPAVLPYLAWGMLLLGREHQLLEGNFVLALERLCQDYYAAIRDVKRWLAHPDVWQDIAANFQIASGDDQTALDRARTKLQSALASRMNGIPELGWLTASSTTPAG